MDELIKGMVDGYLVIFDDYKTNSPSLKQEVEDFKNKLISFGNSISDITLFYTRFTESGLMEEYSAIISKLAHEELKAEAAEAVDESTGEAKTFTVKEFLDQYRLPYEEIKKAGYRKRGEKAYEDIFAVAERTDNMLEAQLILEKERLLWKIVAEDALDIFETIYEAMDPLNKSTTANIELNVETYKKAESDEELRYMLEHVEIEKTRQVYEYLVKMNIVTIIANLLLGYAKSKMQIWEWRNDKSARDGLEGLLQTKYRLREMLNFLKEDFEMDFKDILADEGLKIWLLAPKNADELGRSKLVMDPQNYKVMENIIYKEVLADIAIEDLLKREEESLIYFRLEGAESRQFEKAALAKADDLNQDLTYFRYKKELDGMVNQMTKTGS